MLEQMPKSWCFLWLAWLGACSPSGLTRSAGVGAGAAEPTAGGGMQTNSNAGNASSQGGASGAQDSGDVAGAAPHAQCDGEQPAAESKTLIHPGGLHKRSDLQRMSYQVAAAQEPWTTSFARLSQDARASADYQVQGDSTWTDVQRGGAHGPEYESDATAAYLNALMWAITGDAAHAEKCVEIFNTWKNLKAFVAPGTPALDAGIYAYKLLEAAELIRSTYDGWSAADIQAFSDMLVYPGYSQTEVPASVSPQNGTFYWRIYNGDPGRHGNQDLIAWRALLIMGVFLDNRVMFERALRYFEGLPHRSDDLPYPAGPSVSGAQTADNDYFTTFQPDVQASTPDYGYNGVLEHYVWENGQLQESSRDQQHAFFGLGIAAGIAEVAWNQGDGVWNALDNRLLKGFEFTARYNASYLQTFPDQPTPWEPTGAELITRTDRTGRWRSKAVNPYFESDFTTVSRGDFPGKRPVFEQALAHFGIRMGLPESDTTWTTRARDVALEKYGQEPNGFSLDHPGWGGLTFRRPAECAGDPISGFVEGRPLFAVNVVPQPILAANYDYFPVSGEGHTYHDTAAGNSGGQYRNDDVDVTCSSEGDPVVTDLEAGEWLSFTIAVATAGNHDIDVRYRATSGDSQLALRVDGADVAGVVPLPETGDVWRTAALVRAVPLRPGVQALRLSVVSPGVGLELHSLTPHR